jgi:hypothetical protein
LSIERVARIVREWWPIILGVSLAGAWIYRVNDTVASQARINAAIYEQKGKVATCEANTWALLWWARQISKQNGWVEPPTVAGAKKPVAVNPPGWLIPEAEASELPDDLGKESP